MYQKDLQTLPSKKSLFESFFKGLNPKACNCIKIESPAKVIFSNFCEMSQNSFLQNNRERLLLVVEW